MSVSFRFGASAASAIQSATLLMGELHMLVNKSIPCAWIRDVDEVHVAPAGADARTTNEKKNFDIVFWVNNDRNLTVVVRIQVQKIVRVDDIEKWEPTYAAVAVGTTILFWDIKAAWTYSGPFISSFILYPYMDYVEG